MPITAHRAILSLLAGGMSRPAARASGRWHRGDARVRTLRARGGLRTSHLQLIQFVRSTSRRSLLPDFVRRMPTSCLISPLSGPAEGGACCTLGEVSPMDCISEAGFAPVQLRAMSARAGVMGCECVVTRELLVACAFRWLRCDRLTLLHEQCLPWQTPRPPAVDCRCTPSDEIHGVAAQRRRRKARR